MVGDKRIDLECGWNAGVKESILVRTGYGAQVIVKNAEIVDDLPAAVKKILARP
jgi:phosphoglycolate phosphatase-like HAD superfamily hydrolase